MRNTDRQPRPVGELWLRLIILMLATLLLMALQLTGQLQTLRSAVSFVTSPAQLATTGVGKSVTDGIAFLWELRTLRQRTSELEEINASLRGELFRLNEVERENEQMRRLLAFSETRPFFGPSPALGVVHDPTCLLRHWRHPWPQRSFAAAARQNHRG